jgi:hypothetical protein
MLSTESLICPWCLAPITIVADPSAGEQTYVEDCEVCCRPLSIRLRVDGDGEVLGVDAQRED